LTYVALPCIYLLLLYFILSTYVAPIIPYGTGVTFS
jgi:hypothetical protein